MEEEITAWIYLMNKWVFSFRRGQTILASDNEYLRNCFANSFVSGKHFWAAFPSFLHPWDDQYSAIHNYSKWLICCLHKIQKTKKIKAIIFLDILHLKALIQIPNVFILNIDII